MYEYLASCVFSYHEHDAIKNNNDNIVLHMKLVHAVDILVGRNSYGKQDVCHCCRYMNVVKFLMVVLCI